MSDNIPNPNEHLSLREASEVFGYHPDHLSRLIREGKLYGKRAGRGWVTTRAALAHYASGNYDLAAQAPLLSSPEYVSLKEASDLSGYHPDHLSRLIRQGALYGKRAGRGWATTRVALANYLSGNEELARQEVGIDPRFAASGGVRGLNLDELGDVADDPVLVQAPAMQEKVVAVPAPTPISTPVVSIPGPRGILRGSRKRVVSARSIALVLAAPVAGALLSFGVLAALDNEAGAGSLQGIASRVKGVVESTSNIALQGFSGTFLQNYAAEFATLNTKLDKVGQGVEELLGRTPQVVREEVAVTEVTNNITQEVTNLTQENIVEEVSDGRIVSAVENTNLSGLSVVGLSDLDNVNVNGRLSVDGSFAVAGAVTAPTFKGGRIEVGSAQLGSLTVVDSATLSGDIELGGTLATVAISSGNWNISAAGVADFTQLTVDNIHIDGNTLSSLEGGITFTPFAGEGVSFSLTGSSTFAVNTDDFVVDTATGNISSAGQLQLPTTGSSAGILLGGDVNLYRTASNRLNLGDDDILTFPNRASANDVAIETTVSGDAFYRFQVTADGTLQWGPGNALRDTNLYRDTFNTLRTDDSFEVGGDLRVSGGLAVEGITTANGSVDLGDAVTDTITFVGVVDSDIVPETSTTYDLGSASRRWAAGYFDTITANTLTGVVAGGATTSQDWAINSDNATANAELSTLSFETGTGDFNATLQWNAAGDVGRVAGFDNTFVTNYPLAIYSEVSGGNQTFTSGTLFSYSQPASHAITQSGAFTGINIDFSSNITNTTGTQTGIALTLKDGSVSGGSSGITVAGTADYGIDLSPATYNLGALILPIGTTAESGIDFSGAAGDVVLYRSAAGTLSTNGRFTVGAGSSRGVLFGGDALLYRVSANSLRTDSSLTIDDNLEVVGNTIGTYALLQNSLDVWESYEFGGTTVSDVGIETALDILSDGQLQLPTSGSAAGIVLGGDVQLYRSSANVLDIPDSLRLGVPDTSHGLVDLFSAGAGSPQGGRLNLYIAPDYDDTINNYVLDVQEDDVRLAGSDGNTRALFTQEGQLRLPISGSSNTGLLLGSTVNLYAGAANRLDLASGDSFFINNSSPGAFSVGVAPNSSIGSYFNTTHSGTTGGYLGVYAALNFNITSNSATENHAIRGSSNILGSGDNTLTVTGVYGQNFISGATGTLSRLVGVQAQSLYHISGTGATISDAMGVRVQNPNAGGTQNIISNYGLLIEDQTAGTNDYGIAIAGADTQALWVGSGADNTDAANGIAFGASRDTNLYRSGANRLQTDDDFFVARGSSRAIVQIESSNTFGPELRLSSSDTGAKEWRIGSAGTGNSGGGVTAGDLFFYNGTDSQMRALLTEGGQFSAPATGSSAGLLIGGDTQLYRGAADRLDLASGDSLNLVSGSLQVGGSTVVSSSGTLSVPGAYATIGSGDSNNGILEIFGDGVGSNNGALVRLYTSADHDSVFDYFTLNVFNDDLNIGVGEAFTALRITNDGQLQLPVTGSSAGVLIGGDVNLYRSSANVLSTDDAFVSTAGSIYSRAGSPQFILEDTTDNDDWAFLAKGTSGDVFSIAGNASGTDAQFTNHLGGDFAFLGGDVGVGTTTPVSNSKLDVFGRIVGGLGHVGESALVTSASEHWISSKSLITLGENSAGSANPAITMYRTSAGFSSGTATRIFQPTSAGDLYFQKGTSHTAYGSETYTTNMAILAGGNVGIGTISPSNKLEVSGNLGIVSSNPLLFLGPTNGSFNSTNYHTLGYALNDGYHVSNSLAGDFTIGARASANIRFGTSTSGIPTARLNILSDGKVGVGTTDPQSILHVRAGSSNSVLSGLTLGNESTAENVGVAIDFRNHTTTSVNTARIIAQRTTAANSNSELQFWNFIGGALQEALTINESGQIQAPFTGSSAGLLIGGDVQLYRSAANQLTIPDSVLVQDGSLWVKTAGGAQQTNIRLGVFEDGASTALYEFSTADVGGDKLDLHSNRWASNVIFSRSSVDGYQEVAAFQGDDNAGNRLYIYDATTTTAKILLRSNSYSYFNGGDVLIGGSSIAPLDKLEVFGASANIRINNTDETEAGIIFSDAQDVNGQNASLLFDASSSLLSTYVNNSAVARFSSAGQFQLPTTGSSAGLLIGGDAQLYRGAANRLDLASGDSLNIVSGQIFAGGSSDTGLFANTGLLLAGDAASTHLSLDANEIMAKASGTTAGTLYIQNEGGSVRFLEAAKGTFTVNSDAISVNASNQISMGGPLTLRKGDGSSNDIGRLYGGSDGNDYIEINGAGSDDHISFVLASELARITGAGQFQLPTTGSSAGLLLGGDVQLYRGSADMLYLGRDDKLRITRSGSGAGALEFHVSGDTQNRMFISSSGSLNWGSGSAVQDTSLYRSAANILKTDDSFEVGGAIRAAEAPTVALNTTLTTIDSTGDVGSDASLAIGTDGLPIISYYDATDTDLKVAHCENASCSTSTITTVDSTGSVGRQTSIAIGADGLPVISYLNGGAVNDLKLAHCDDVSCSSATLTTIDSVGSVGFYSSIAIGADGNPIISYYDTTNDDLKVAHCENASCSASTITTVDSTGDVGTWSSIAIGADDLAVISYYDATNADLKVAHCDNISCSSSTVNSVVSADFAGTYSSIAIGADGFPLISYYSATNNALELIDCGDAFCTSTIQTVVDPGANGAHTSITLSTEGLPIISYFSLPTDTLKLAHCSTVSCSNKVITTIDHSMGSFAGHTSIAIGTDGNPVISYYTGDPNRDLKVAHIATTYTGGSNIGSATDFFNNIYSANLNLADSPSAGITFGSGNGSIDLYRSAPNTLSVSGGSDLTIVDGSLRFGAGVNLYQSAPQTLGVAGGLSLSGDILASVMPMAAGVTQTITTVDATGGARHYTSIAIGTDGLPVISYLDDINDDLKVAKCTAADCSTSTLTTVDATDNVGLYTSIAIGTDGLPIISYRDDTNQDLKVAKCTAADCSTSTLTTVDATGNVGQFTSIAIGTDGLPVISYRDSSSAALKVAKCDDSSCSTSTTIIVDSSDVQFTAIATGVDGNPVVAYYAIGTGDLKVAHCTDISCTAPTLTTVDATGTVGQWVGIAIGTDGLPVISYRDVTNSDLKVAKCTDISCTASTLTTVDATGTVGDDTSIAIGTDGLPVISYYDTTNGDLKVAKCTAADCSTSTLTTVDATDNVGENTSIAIGTDGLPVISYRDVTNSDLKVAKCGTPSCSGNGYAPLGGSNIGSLGNHFNNVYANQYWGKSFSIANFDLAEEYFSEDSLTPGTIVSVYSGENGREDQVQQSSTPYEETLMGIVSTQPGITLADWQQQDKTGMYPIALAGRVPVKVSNENGDIKPGDAITSSSVPGVGMKATQPGRIVGIALTGFEADGEEGEGADVITGTVTVFVSTGYHIPSEYFAALAEGEEGGAVAFLQNFVDLVLKVRTLVASLVQTDRIEVKNPYGITIYDTVTGEPYCVVSVNGKLESIAGTCEEVAEGIEPTPEEQQVEEESVQEPDAEPEGQTEEQDAESVVEESQQEGAPAEVEEEEVEQIEQGTQQPQEESSGEEQLQEPQPQEEPTQEEAPQPQEQAADEGEVQDSAPSQSEPGVGGEEAAPQS